MGPGPLTDIHDGGAVMWIGGDGLVFVMMLVVPPSSRWSNLDRPQAGCQPRQTRDKPVWITPRRIRVLDHSVIEAFE